MNSIEKGAAAVAIVIAIFTAGAAWNSLNNRIDKVDEKIGQIQRTLGSTPCSAILGRELAAIDKGRADIRKELEKLASNYGCPQTVVAVPNLDGEATAALRRENSTVTDPQLNAALNAVDMRLNTKR